MEAPIYFPLYRPTLVLLDLLISCLVFRQPVSNLLSDMDVGNPFELVWFTGNILTHRLADCSVVSLQNFSMQSVHQFLVSTLHFKSYSVAWVVLFSLDGLRCILWLILLDYISFFGAVERNTLLEIIYWNFADNAISNDPRDGFSKRT